MMKRVISLSLCLIMVLAVFAGCAKEKDENDYGAYINMYLTDPMYNFDPALAYGNDTALKVISLLYSNLFVLNENGKVEKQLAKDYTVDKEKNTMTITLNSTNWSNGDPITAADVVSSWRRLLDNENSYAAASLLFDIKNARAAKENSNGNTVDDVKIEARGNELFIEFEDREGGIDYDRFILNLTSYALVPLPQKSLDRTVDPMDWAKKPSLFVTSGPFKVREASYHEESPRLVLERNAYYYRNPDLDDIDISVTPFQLIIDYSKTDDEIKQAYENGTLFYMGDIPLSIRGNWKHLVTEDAKSLSTHSYVLNQNAIVRYYDEEGFKNLSGSESAYNTKLTESDGEKIFANANVRKALSMAIDREAIANKVVFAKAATALVPPSVFNKSEDVGLFSKSSTFRSEGKDLLSTTADSQAASVLQQSGIDPSKFMFAIAVPAYDDVQLAIAQEVQKAWSALGFHVAINAMEVIENTDYDNTTDSPIADIKDDIYQENYIAGNYEVAAVDYVAATADPFSVLAPFAQGYTGEASGGNEAVEVPVHATGYRNDAYTQLIDSAFKTFDLNERARLLHEAEEILMNDLPLIPIVYNVDVTLVSEELSKVKFSYYGAPVFTKTQLKNYLLYAPQKEEN